jgi:3-phosphoshikimate 1-carboxyvinyltransferase
MKAQLSHTPSLKKHAQIILGGSKSESNRLLILQALFFNIAISNLSTSDDSKALIQALDGDKKLVDVHHAGTAMRFLTAYFATHAGREVTLTGSERMQQRPIGILVDALRSMGADIEYQKNEGFPPLLIKGKNLTIKEVTIAADVSSQFISALMLIAPSLPQGLVIHLDGNVTSAPYLKMTYQLLMQLGFEGDFSRNMICMLPGAITEKKHIRVESDWSSVSYLYSLVALSQSGLLSVSTFKKDSLQGDVALTNLYKALGVETVFNEDDGITLQKISEVITNHVEFDLVNTPDIAQTIAVTCFGLGISCHLTGLHTLKIKETDRLYALKIELEKLGAIVNITEDSLSLEKSVEIKAGVAINTYQDHRMAMAFAPLALKTSLSINDAEVVSKSFPEFWDVLKELGILLKMK